jgi:hypothetical protein
MIPKKENPGAWLAVLTGVLIIWLAYPRFLSYLQTGEAFHPHTRSIPFDLYGGDAAAIDGIYLLAGLFLVATGLRKLFFGR